MTDTALAVVEKIDPVIVFTGGGMDAVLSKIKDIVNSHEPDVSTVKGRKERISLSSDVSKSKTFLEKIGKKMADDLREKVKVDLDRINTSRRVMKETLDALRDETRRPVTEWENAEKAKLEAERIAKEIEDAHAAALVENDLIDRMREVERKEAELRAKAEAEQQKALEEKLERDRIERDERIKKEAAENAKREAEEKAEHERQESIRREQEAKEATERAEREKVAAIERAKIEKEMAIKEEQRKAKEEAERVECDRIAKEEAARKERERIASNKAHQGKINREALSDLRDLNIDKHLGQAIITAIAKGEIRHLQINY